MKTPDTTKQKGDRGEEEAAAYLRGLGYEILHQKWKHERYELDLVAQTRTHVVFVEVKVRFSNTYGEPWEAVNKGKRKRICVGADAYIREFSVEKEPRFDIISILKMGKESTLSHIEEAFWPVA